MIRVKNNVDNKSHLLSSELVYKAEHRIKQMSLKKISGTSFVSFVLLSSFHFIAFCSYQANKPTRIIFPRLFKFEKTLVHA